MIQTLNDLLAQIPDEQKEGLEASVRDLVLTDDSLVEVKMGGGPFEEDGDFSLGVFMAVMHTCKSDGGETTLADLVSHIDRDVHNNAEWLFKRLFETAQPPYRLTYIPLGAVDNDHTWALHFSINAALKPVLQQ